VFDLPEGASYAAGASFLTTYLTAQIPLVHQVRIKRGSVVLVHAGSGGVGSAAIQLAKRLGARVIATAGAEEKRAFARGLGADETRGYDEIDDLKVDVIFDPVGGELFTRSLALLNPLGTIVAIGFAGGLWQDPSVQWLVGRNVTVSGFYLGRLMTLQPDLVREAAHELLEVWARGEIDPPVGATFPLAEANEAHALIESRRHVGKVVLEP
jgi:NADPH:quinone reductase